MILDKEILKYKSKIAASEAGVLTMYAMYSMTDTFIPKSFQIGIGISQTNVIANLNYEDDFALVFMNHES